jgi:hypothetical protein
MLLVSMLCACKDPGHESVEEPAPTTVERSATAVASLDFEPLPERLALPLKLLDMRIEGPDAGTLYDENFPDGTALRAVGLNQCQTGWVLQGFLRSRPGAELRATPPFQIALPTLPSGQTVEQTHPTLPGQTMVLDFDEATMRRLKGSFRVVDDATSEEVFRMEIDTVPVTVTPAAGLGPQGCFSTGSWRMTEGDKTLQGSTSAVFDGRRVHYIGMRLTEKYGIGMWLILQPQHRQAKYVLRGNLRRIIEEPKKYPFRVVFETRNPDSRFGMTVDELQALDGDFRAAFRKPSAEGPVRIEIENLKVPDAWEGPLSGTIDRVRVDTLIVTDTNGTSVPIPTGASFD